MNQTLASGFLMGALFTVLALRIVPRLRSSGVFQTSSWRTSMSLKHSDSTLKNWLKKSLSNAYMIQTADFDSLELLGLYRRDTSMRQANLLNGHITPGPFTTILGLSASQVRLLLS